MAYNNPYGQPPPGAPSGRRAPPRQGIISRSANAVIGATAEGIAARKQKKDAQPTTYNERLTAPPSYDQAGSGRSSPNRSRSNSARSQKSNSDKYPPEKGRAPDDDDDDYDNSDLDGDELDLDEAAQEVKDFKTNHIRRPPPTGNIASPAAIKTLVTSYVEQFPPPRQPIGQLQMPVIIPQRRPRNKSRGFIQAYAPMLMDAGISQEAFLSFFEYFEEAIKVSPIFDIINLGANIAGFVPEPTTQIVSTVVSTVDYIAQEMYTRSRSNDFLGKLNEVYFKPHGLFCMIVAYKPEEPNSLGQSVNVATGAVSGVSTTIPQQTKSGKFRVYSAQTKGETQMPEPAPLIFPQLDEWAARGGVPETKKGTGFMRDYFDRRGQQLFAQENPDAVLAANPNFISKYADPSYQAQFTRPSRMLLSAIGPSRDDGQPGIIQQHEAQRVERRAARQDYRSERRAARRARRGPGLIGGVVQGVTQLATGKKQDPRERTGAIGMIRKILRQDALYLMVAQLPTAEQRAYVGKAMKEAGVGSADTKGIPAQDAYAASSSKGLPPDAPPAYDDIAGSSSSGPSTKSSSLMTGGPPMGDKKR